MRGFPNDFGAPLPPAVDVLDTIHFINCVLLNARSIVNKLHDLDNLLSTSNLGLICITETWLNPSINDSLLCNGHNYSIFRKDRTSHGGGVCLIVSNDCFKAVQVSIPDRYSHLEIVVIDICNCAANKCRVFLCYRPPSNDYNIDALRYSMELCECIELLQPLNATVLVCGDFNLPKVNWSNIDMSSGSKATCSSILVNLFTKLAFHQFVSEPTRYNASSHSSSILDLILCNDVNFVHDTCACGCSIQ